MAPQLSDVSEDVHLLCIQRVAVASMRHLACTSTYWFHLVLQASNSTPAGSRALILVTPATPRLLATRLWEHGEQARAQVRFCLEGGGAWHATVPLPTALRLLAEHVGAGEHFAPTVLLQQDTTSVRALQAPGMLHQLPPRMGQLTRIDVTGCMTLAVDQGAWLPSSSAEQVVRLVACHSNVTSQLPALPSLTHLDVSHTRVDCVPEHLSSMRSLHVAGCPLTDSWLPPSSTPSLVCIHAQSSTFSNAVCLPLGLEDLDLSNTRLEALPENMTSLRTLRAAGCTHLTTQWLPVSSARGVCALDARESRVYRLPEGLSAVTALELSGSCIRTLPEGMTSLETVRVDNCPLRTSWLPVASARKVRLVSATVAPIVVDPALVASLGINYASVSANSRRRRLGHAFGLPPGMVNLRELLLSGRSLCIGGLPRSSTANLTRVEGVNLQ